MTFSKFLLNITGYIRESLRIHQIDFAWAGPRSEGFQNFKISLMKS
jgi:hypothetical protein